VGFAADGAARLQSTLGVAVVTYGAGAFNIVNAVAGAYAERSPVVVIAGAPGARERSSGLLLHHQARSVDTQLAVMREVTCDQAVLDDVERAPAEIARVLRSAQERSLPVYIELPRDLAQASCAKVPLLPARGPNHDALNECAEEVLLRLRAAKRPIVIVDVEVRRYALEQKVAELARRYGVPVVTTFMGRGLLAGADDVVLGTYMGNAGSPVVQRAVEHADAALLLGVIVSDTNFALSERVLDPQKTMLAIDRHVRIGYHDYADIPLAALVDALIARAPRKPAKHAKSKAQKPRFKRKLRLDDAPLTPSDIAVAINELFDRHGQMLMTADVGDCLFTAMEVDNNEFSAPGYYAGMGFAVPAALGMAAVSGRRPLVLLGDGAFQMTGFELAHCRRYGLDPIVVVFNNQSWELLRVFQPESAFNDLDDWQFAKLAPLLGGHGERVRTRRELGAALTRAVERRGVFSLVEVMLPRGLTSETLRRYVEGFEAARTRSIAPPRPSAAARKR
jgi:indolepyruvate decarboxylase